MKNYKSEGPTFIVEMNSMNICDINDEVRELCGTDNTIGKKITDIVYFERKAGNIAFFNNRWFMLKREKQQREGNLYLQLSLKDRKDIPNPEILHSLKKMIEYLLHRLRSPLTAIQGYAKLFQDQSKQDSNNRYINQVNHGVSQLVHLLDELESLQNISLDTAEPNSYTSDTEKVIYEVLSAYSSETRKKIFFTPSADPHLLHCYREDLQRILLILLDNAIEYSSGENKSISIKTPSPHTIKITNNGPLIPESISKQIFFPFITTKANKLGIGLTIALLYARKYRGTISLTNNAPNDVSFTLCLPPSLPVNIQHQ